MTPDASGQARRPVTVRGESVLLRPFAPDADAAAIDAAAADPLIQLWNPITLPGYVWCANRADWSAGDHASWAVSDPADPRSLLGAVSLHKIDCDQRDCEVGFLVLAAHRGHGLAAQAVRAAVSYAFVELQLRRVNLLHAVGNPGSCGVARAAGFRLEGTHVRSYRYGDGLWHDEHSHARLRD